MVSEQGIRWGWRKECFFPEIIISLEFVSPFILCVGEKLNVNGSGMWKLRTSAIFTDSGPWTAIHAISADRSEICSGKKHSFLHPQRIPCSKTTGPTSNFICYFTYFVPEIGGILGWYDDLKSSFSSITCSGNNHIVGIRESIHTVLERNWMWMDLACGS